MTTFHLPGGQPGSVAKARTAARGGARDSRRCRDITPRSADAMIVRVAIVAGAGGALGRATTAVLAAGGLIVVAVDRNERALRELPGHVRREVADTTRHRRCSPRTSSTWTAR